MSGDRGYIAWRPCQRTRAKLDAVQEVLATYHDQLPLTLRQLYYVLVAKLVIEKTKREYCNLGYLVSKARRARVIPFESIHDQGSTLPSSLLGDADESWLAWSIRYEVENFELDRQLGQANRLVLWCEAAGMLDQLRRVAEPYGVHVVAGGGFDSVTDKWRFAQLVRKARGKVRVPHIGDLDRHGESIFDVLAEDVQAFDGYRGVDFVRLAVTEQQVEELGLVSSFEDELVVQAEAIPPDVLAHRRRCASRASRPGPDGDGRRTQRDDPRGLRGEAARGGGLGLSAPDAPLPDAVAGDAAGRRDTA
jgi:hypothetical protein